MSSSVTQYSQEKRESIKWGLKPVLIFAKLCGIPVIICEPNGSSRSRVVNCIWKLTCLVCLLLNCFFQIYNCVTLPMIACYPFLNGMKRIEFFPTQFLKILVVLLDPIFKTGVPLAFAFQFYFTGRFEKIWSSIQTIDEMTDTLPKSFYRKCRKRCLILISISFLEMAIYLIPLKQSILTKEYDFDIIIQDYNFGKLFDFLNFGLNGICNRTIYLQKMRTALTPVNRKFSLATGIWVQLSAIAVLTIFCALILVASLLAEELSKRTKKERFPTESTAVSLALEHWLKRFDQLHVLVERIKNFFGPILAIILFYYFAQFPQQVYLMFAYWNFTRLFPVTLMLLVRFITTVTVCHKLTNKFKNLQSSLNRLHISKSSSPDLKLQRENIGLQVSNQYDVKVTALDMCDIDVPLIYTLLGFSLTYGAIIIETARKDIRVLKGGPFSWMKN